MDRKSCFFYPCAGSDINPAISFFNTKVDSFWFVDSRSYRHRLPKIDIVGRPKPLEEFSLGNAKVMRVQMKDRFGNRNIELNFVDGDGEFVFRTLFGANAELDLTVFFYRGDSRGEGGSGVCWLSDVDSESGNPGLLKLVLENLRKPGLIATDGSNGHDGFRKYFDATDDIPDAHLRSAPFCVDDFDLSPVDSVGPRYGPTIVWSVHWHQKRMQN